MLGCAANLAWGVSDPPGPVAREQRIADGWRLLLEGETARSAETFAELLSEQPDEVAVMEGRIRALLAGQFWREALAESAGFVETYPANPRLLAARGEVLFRAGRFAEAQSVLEKIEKLEPPPGRGLMVLGRLRDAQGRQEEAIALMASAVAVSADDRDVLYWASGSTSSRGAARRLLQAYLELSVGDDPDRIESARGSIKFYEELGEKPIWITEERPERLELPLEPIWDPNAGRILGYVIRVQLGSKKKPVPLLLDSGSPGLFVIERIARKRGFEPIVEKTVFGGGGDQRHRTRRGFFESVAVGGLSFSSALATTSKDELDPTGRYHGLIGLSVFNGYRVTLDFRRKLLVLEPPSESIADASPYWSVLGQFVVQAELDGELPGMFLLDSGATRTMLAGEWAERLPTARLGRSVKVHGFGGGMQGARSLDGVAILFQGQSTPSRGLRTVDLSMRSRLAGVEIAGFLGLDFLGQHRIVIDTMRRTVRLLPSAGD